MSKLTSKKRAQSRWMLWMLVFLWELHTILAAEADKGDLLALFKDKFLNESAHQAEIPRNISDIYKGTWIYDDVGSMNFRKSKGRIVFQIANEKSHHQEIDLVHGTMTFRDGLYTTNTNLKISLQGLYFHATGELILLGNPRIEIGDVMQHIEHITKQVPKDDEDDDREALHKRELQDSVLSDVKFAFREDQPISVHSVLQEFAKLRQRVPSVKKPQKCYFEVYMKMAHYDKFANPDMKGKIEEEEGYSSVRMEGEANPFIEVNGVAYSPNCHTLMSTTASSIYFNDYYRKALNYVVFVCVATFIQVLALLDQINHTESQTALSKVSLVTIGQQAILDSYLCLVHLTAGLVMEQCFNAFALASFLKFVSFSIFQMKYLLSIWKSKNTGSGESFRTELGIFYMKFYSVLLSGFALLYFLFSFFEIFLIVFYSFWIPQIYANCVDNHTKSVRMKYVVGTSITRMFLPFYFLGCPENFLFIEPKPKLILLLVVWLGMQNLILWLQDKIGARFFIPNYLLPPKYDYQHQLDLSLLLQEGEKDERAEEEKKQEIKFVCVICLSGIDITSNNSYMITPCNHLYHKTCLMEWMEHKMECCVCKRPLPFVE